MISRCQLNDDSCLRGSVVLHQSKDIGGSAKGMLLMVGIPEIVDSKGVTIPEIGETLSAAMKTFPEIADTADGSDIDVLEKESMKAAWVARMLRPRFLTIVLGKGVFQLRKE